MLFSLNQLKGFDIKAIDGEIGKLDEVYFDDGCWQTRYLVVNVGNWLLREQVLLIPQVVTGVDPQAKTIQVALTKEEVESSPDALEVTPVSRQREIALHRHYQWTPYWDVDPLATAGFGRMPYTIKAPNLGVKASVQLAEDPLTLSSPGMEEQASRPAGRDDQAMTPVDLRPSGRLRSSHEVNGYPILSQDGEVGHLEDFLMDPDLRFTRFLVVDTGGWLAGKKVVVPPTFVHKFVKISLCDSGVALSDRVLPGDGTEPLLSGSESHPRLRKGLGLGILLAHRVVQAHQGLMRFEERPDFKSCVSVYLPV